MQTTSKRRALAALREAREAIAERGAEADSVEYYRLVAALALAAKAAARFDDMERDGGE